jgi:hypothetical protein
MVHGHWARQDADLSYMNQPAILTMLLVAGFTGLSKHFLSWAALEPPKYCLDRMFVTAEGVTIEEQVLQLTEVRLSCGHAANCTAALHCSPLRALHCSPQQERWSGPVVLLCCNSTRALYQARNTTLLHALAWPIVALRPVLHACSGTRPRRRAA